jgi:hypothetical protein
MPSRASSPTIPPDALDLLRAFCAAEVRFLVVGAHALGFHGAPRATGDFDLFVEPTPGNAERVLAALGEFGAPLFDLSLEDLARPDVVFQMGVPPYRIDLNTSITGVSFDEAWRDHGVATIEGLAVPVISRDAMIRNKRATGRPKDLLDLELLGEGRRES